MDASLWGEEFTLNTEEKAKKILTKAKNPKKQQPMDKEKALKSKSVSVEDKIKIITEEVHKILGHFEEDTIVIKSEKELEDYITAAIQNGIIAIDTETGDEEGYGSLNTYSCNLMGLCLYTPAQKNAYVPVNHVDIITKEKLKWQVTEEQIGKQLQRLLDNQVFEVYHNATFDIEVLKSTCGIKLKADWDTLVGAQLLDENELKGLKTQYRLHINPEQEKYDIEKLFQNMPYSIFPAELFALYAASDAFLTYSLYEWQKKKFKAPGMEDVYKLFQEIEIPVIDVLVDMELAGVEVDLEYAKKMSVEYHKRSDEVQSRIDAELDNLAPMILEWKASPEANAKQITASGKEGKSKNEQLSDPIELSSPTQMAILLYDILKAPVVDKKKPRTTDAAALDKFANEKHIKICELLLEKREVDILINSFIDKIPVAARIDGHIHTRFNQCGTQTGRFSSSGDMNLQQIPSHEKSIRMIFTAGEGNSIVGADFGAQEPRSLASFSKDKAMLDAYEQGKDLYAVIGEKCFHNDYYSNLEFKPTLVTDIIHTETIDVNSNKLSLLSDDEVNINGDYVLASSLKAGDHLMLSDRVAAIKRVSLEGIYVNIDL